MPTPQAHEHPDHSRTDPRARHVSPLVPASAWLTDAHLGVRLPPPRRDDHIIFVRGLPVAPWMTLRPWSAVWSVWLARLEALFQEWQVLMPGLASSESEANEPAEALPAQSAGRTDDWPAWCETHVHSLEARRVERGLDTLRQVLASLTPGVTSGLTSGLTRETTAGGDAPAAVEAGACAHLIGHSVGGAVILAYLAELRAHPQEMPAVPLRVALTLDAAVSGLAGAWSGAKSYLHRLTGNRIMAQGLLGLNGWASEQGIHVLTVSNAGDLWSHKPLADLPFLGVRLGSRLALADQLNGTIHDWLRRTPEFVEAIWGPALAGPDGNGD